MRQMEKDRVYRDFESLAESQARAVVSSVAVYNECLFTLRSKFATSKWIDHDEFRVVAADLRKRHSGIHLLQWLPRVKHEQRATFETVGRRDVHPNWIINQGYPLNRLNKDPVEARSEYLPIFYIEPPEGNEVAYGFDHFRGPHQAIIQRAIESGTAQATRRIILRQPGVEEWGWVVFLPVFEGGITPETPEQRWAKLAGIVEGAFRFSDLIKNSSIDPHYSLELFFSDRTADSSEPFLFSAANGNVNPRATPVAKNAGSQMAFDYDIDSSSRHWVMVARPKAEWLAAKTTGFPYAVLFFGAWLSAVLATSIHNTRRRSETITHLVDTRTEQLRQTQEQLREDNARRRQVEERYRTFVEQSTEAIWRFEMKEPLSIALPEKEQIEWLIKHAQMAECNEVCARMYGYEAASEMVGKRLEEIMPMDDPINVEHLSNYVRSRFRLVDSESHEVNRQGQKRVFINNIIGIVENGCLVRAWGTQRDMTDIRQLEEARKMNEQRLRVALEAADLGLWEWDRRSGKVTWNDELHAIFKLPTEARTGSQEEYLSLIHPDDKERVARTVADAMHQGSEFEYEYRIVRPDGVERWIYTKGDVRKDERGRVIGMLGAAIDITARKEADDERLKIEHRLQEAQKLESLGILAGGIAHDFNNLLTGMLGNAALARMDMPSTSPVQENLSQIEHAAQRAADLCKQMLAYSGKGRFVVQSLSLSQLVEDAMSLLQISVSKNVVLKLRLEPGLPPVSADATQLNQILMNLVINASDAIGERSGVIEISTSMLKADRVYLSGTHLSPNLPEGDYVCLEVSDNGCGMNHETRQKIFDPFFTTKFTGRGLGLAAVLGIVRGHNGALKVYSELGKGSTFKLLLPRADGFADPEGDEEIDDVPWQGSGMVLVIDDEDTVRQVAQRMLQKMGFEVIIATNGREGLSLFVAHEENIVAVLLDLTMPEMDGTQTFTELRRLKPDLRVLLMSGFNEQEAINRFAGKGLAGFMQKPFRPDVLRDKLKMILEKQDESANG